MPDKARHGQAIGEMRAECCMSAGVLSTAWVYRLKLQSGAHRTLLAFGMAHG